MNTTLIEHADVLISMRDSCSGIHDAYIVLRDGKVHELGAGAPPDIPVESKIDARGCIVMPGLINMHHHFYQTLTRAYPTAVDSCLFPWLVALYPIWEGITTDSVRLGTSLAMAELLLSGCSTTVDHHYVFPKATDPRLIDIQIEVARELGMRFVATRGSMSRGESAGGLPPDSVVQDEGIILEDCERLIKQYHDPDPFAMIQIALAPCSPFSVSPRLLRQSADLSKKTGVLLHTHLAETTDEVDYCRRHYGCTPVELLKKTGWLCDRTWLAHGIHFSSKEIALLGAHGVGIAHCPTSNMRLASGIAPVPALLEAGCPVGLAVDGSASNDSSHMLLEIRQCLLLGRLGAGADAFSVKMALQCATIGGAACLRREEALGRLLPGAAADVAIFDISDIGHSGAVDPVAGLVLCAPARVKHLFVGGKHIVQDGALPGVDLTELICRHRIESARLATRLTH